jgi:hypothetical protein
MGWELMLRKKYLFEPTPHTLSTQNRVGSVVSVA